MAPPSPMCTPTTCEVDAGGVHDLAPRADRRIYRRDESFSDIELDVAPLDVGGDYACVEWSVAMTHTGPLAVANGMSIEPTGTRIALHGVTVAEFRGDRICALRQYWDELSVYDQLGLLGSDSG